LSFVDLSLVLEEFGRSLVPPTAVDTLVASAAIAKFGTDEQKSTLLCSIGKGNLRIAIAICEMDAGYDMADIRTGLLTSLSLQGQKILVAASDVNKLLVVCRVGEEGKASLLMLEPDRPGVSIREQETLDPSSFYAAVSFEKVELTPNDFLIPVDNTRAANWVADGCSLGAATLMTGISGAVLEATVDYVKQRQQFGKPVGSFQAIKHRCADMMVALNSSRSAAYYAAWAFANESKDLAKAISIAKSFCGDSSRFICDQGIQLHGGMGFTWDLGLHFYLRRAKMLEYAYGDASYHRKRLLRESLAEFNM
jgi:alkylation response protein AidB-like acyl-CoA dehydrogenase